MFFLLICIGSRNTVAIAVSVIVVVVLIVLIIIVIVSVCYCRKRKRGGLKEENKPFVGDKSDSDVNKVESRKKEETD